MIFFNSRKISIFIIAPDYFPNFHDKNKEEVLQLICLPLCNLRGFDPRYCILTGMISESKVNPKH